MAGTVSRIVFQKFLAMPGIAVCWLPNQASRKLSRLKPSGSAHIRSSVTSVNDFNPVTSST